ncbi:MAG: hypothetical protein K0U72_03885 [Gammaproteobacteria bacterium]|nr:hypothetical protein [Gammaproteobacteria bacterium]
MRVISKLAQIDFQFGKIGRDGNLLVIESDPEAKMPSTVYVSPQDVIEFLKRFLVSPRAIVFVLGMPYFLYRWKKQGQGNSKAGKQRKREWPTV